MVDEMFLAGEIRETSQIKVLKQLTTLTSLEWMILIDILIIYMIPLYAYLSYELCNYHFDQIYTFRYPD